MQSATLENLVSTLNALAEAGFQIGLGTDGGGIFGASSFFVPMLDLLAANGLSERAKCMLHSASQCTD